MKSIGLKCVSVSVFPLGKIAGSFTGDGAQRDQLGLASRSASSEAGQSTA